jgi:hypothetical protein
VNKGCALADIIGQLDCLDVDERARTAFRGLVVAIGMQHGVKGIERIEQLAYVRRLLALRVSRPTIRDRVTARYPVSRRQAYRLIDEALQLCQKRPEIGTNHADNERADCS